jgi:frataxin-like iron-binding protein CyaY
MFKKLKITVAHKRKKNTFIIDAIDNQQIADSVMSLVIAHGCKITIENKPKSLGIWRCTQVNEFHQRALELLT